MNKEEFFSTCSKLQFGDFAVAIFSKADLAAFGREVSEKMVRSFVGGSPVPEIEQWPILDGERTFFLGQIDCSDVPSGVLSVPNAGVLQFFSNATENLWEAPKINNGVVLYRSVRCCQTASAGRPLRFETDLTLHSYEPYDLSASAGWDANKYFEIKRRLFAEKSWLCQLGGYAEPVQDDMGKELQTLDPESGNWKLLACFDGMTEEIGPLFGRYYFWIPEKELLALNFEKTIMLFQS